MSFCSFVVKHYRSKSLKKKIFTAFTALFAFSFFLFFALTYLSIQRSNTDQLMYASNHAINQTSEVLNHYLAILLSEAEQFAVTPELGETILRDSGLDASPVLMEDYTFMRQLMLNAYSAKNMQKLTLFLPDSVAYSSGLSSGRTPSGYAFDRISSIREEKWYSSLTVKNSKGLWNVSSSDGTDPLSPEGTSNTLSYIRTIKNPNNYHENIGILKVDIPQSDINQILINGTSSVYDAFLILNTDGELVACSDPVSYTDHLSDITAFLADRPGEQVTWEKISGNHTPLFVSTRGIRDTDWTMVSITPTADIRIASKNALVALLPVAFLLIFFSILFSALFSRSITRRIVSLTEHIKTVSDSHLPTLMEESGSDEISILISSYNYMINKIQFLLEQQYKLGKDVERAQIKTLQAQINPHFLYNTLDLINWMAIEKQVPDICNMIQDLSTFYKLNLSHGADFVTISSELTLIETYIHLQNRKYENRFTLTLDVSEDIRQCCILKMLLQPIVENAIIHGILENDQDTGSIQISAREIREGLALTISDNGIGISPAKLDEPNHQTADSSDQGYGIHNIRERIHLNYGKEYGISFRSSLSQGTSVEVTIPKRKSPPTQTDGDPVLPHSL